MKAPNSFSDSLRVAEKHLSRRDAVLRKFIKQHGECRLQMHTRYFETLVNSIVSQQLSTKAAATIFNRFRALYAPAKFPQPAQIAATPDELLRSVGLSSQKLSYIKDLAAKLDEGTVHLQRLTKMSDAEIIAELTQVKGIGVWTVQMFLIFSLGRLDVLPVGDLGIKMAMQRAYSLAALPKPAEIEIIAQQNHWHPYCSVASWYLWRSLENKAM
jgi:DNA-3-methyladenine glycosylase II